MDETCFAVDWEGWVYAVGPEGVVVVDVDAWERVVTGVGVVPFHDELQAHDWRRLLRPDRFLQALQFVGRREINSQDCVAQQVPSMLGGRWDQSNVAVQDLDVYLSITVQTRGRLM